MPTILCVDDVQDERDGMAELLECSGYKVSTAATPEEALFLFDSNPFSFDVVLTDLLFKNNPLNGVDLMKSLLDRRDERGYAVTPEVICLTGELEMLDPDVANDVKIRGGQYVQKGSPQYILEVKAAFKRIQKFKDKGPTLLFVHTAAQDSGWSEPLAKRRYCPVGELVSAVYFMRSGQLMDDENLANQRLPLSPIHMRLLDFFARKAIRKPMRVQEVAHSYSQDEFYACWLSAKQEQTIESSTIRNYVRKIREAFDAVGLRGHEILVTENFSNDEEEDESSGVAYRLHAWPIIQHLR